MQKFGYKLVIATKGSAVWCKPYEKDKKYNQILYLFYKEKIKQSYACVELAFNDGFITRNDLAAMEDALNKAWKDLGNHKVEFILATLQEMGEF